MYNVHMCTSLLFQIYLTVSTLKCLKIENLPYYKTEL